MNLGYLLLIAFAVCVALYAFYPPFREWIKGWRTLGTAGTVGALGAMQYANWTDVFSDKRMAGLMVIGIAAAFAFLRIVTTKPVGQ